LRFSLWSSFVDESWARLHTGIESFVSVLCFLSQASRQSNEKTPFSAVDIFISDYFATCLLSITKPPFSAVDMFVSGYFVAWLLSLNKCGRLLRQ
jgi:hypothetical protein